VLAFSKEHATLYFAVLVKNNKLIAKAHNQPILNNDPTAHAEIQLLRKAGKILALVMI
jgi:tRNA(Arg) A34 adenosine deaminase TadA